MQVRTISPQEIDRFAAAAPHSLRADGFAQYIRELWAQGISRPERCFVIESDGQFIARVLYRGQGEEVSPTGLSLPWQGDYHAVGRLLLHESLSRLRDEGVKRFEVFVTSAWDFAPQLRSLLDALQMPLVQEKVRYEWQTQPLETTVRLHYRTLAEVGDVAFIEAIRRVSADSFDRLDGLQRRVLGEQQHAQEYYNILRNEFDHFPAWWMLAYTPQGDLVGHVVGIPYNLSQQQGTIGYIGIVPEQRGHGYIHDLLAQGMTAMVKEGITTLICDTDALNTPMIAAFKRHGYVQTGTVRVYHAELDMLLT